MNGRYLLDTTIAVALLRGDPAISQRLGQADEVFMNSIVLGELYYGARHSARAEENLAQIETFATEARVITCDRGTADRYGRIKNRLRIKGRPIPENDIWIAATAQQHDLTLVSRDLHFQEVDGLTLETW